MKFAADFRRIGRQALSGHWTIAVITGLVAVLLGGAVSGGPEINLKLDETGANIGLNIAGQPVFSSNSGLNSELVGFLVGGLSFLLVTALVMAVLYFILGSVVGVGYARFNLNLVDRKQADVGTLFKYFPHWKTTAAARFLRGLYSILWALLFIIPGIMAAYSYAMTDYILAEYPEMTAGEAITRSKEMMYGNRFRLFCLQFSFIGWALLCALTLGIGNLWLTPYKEAATAAFYREVSGTESVLSTPQIDLK